MSSSTQTSNTPPGTVGVLTRGGIVVGVDGSASAESAARWAADEAHRRELPLTIVHAVHLPDALTAPLEPYDHAEHRRAEGRALLARIAANINAQYPDLAVTTELSAFSPAHALEAASHAASLIVTGTRGCGGFTGVLLGSVTHALAAHARCPLVVVPRETPADALDEVVLGVGPRHSEAAIRYAFEAARGYRASLTVVRAWWPAAPAVSIAVPGGMYVPDPEIFRAAADDDAQASIKALTDEFPDVSVRVELREGNAVELLLGAASRARLLVVGAPRHHSPLTLGAGYVVDGVIAHSPVPVAVVPAWS